MKLIFTLKDAINKISADEPRFNKAILLLLKEQHIELNPNYVATTQSEKRNVYNVVTFKYAMKVMHIRQCTELLRLMDYNTNAEHAYTLQMMNMNMFCYKTMEYNSEYKVTYHLYSAMLALSTEHGFEREKLCTHMWAAYSVLRNWPCKMLASDVIIDTIQLANKCEEDYVVDLFNDMLCK